MRKLIPGLLAVVALVLLTTVALGQTETTTTTLTKTVQNPDGTYSIIEYPVGREVTVALNPISLSGATGTATVLRDPDGTTIKLNLQGLPNTLMSLNMYAVDADGVAHFLGPMVIGNGTGVFTTTAKLDKFMIVASPEANLSEYTPETKIYFRSAVPEGFAVVPFRTRPRGEEVSATSTRGETSVYRVPMLNIPAYKVGDETKLKVNFSGAMEGARANIFIEPRKHSNATEVRVQFHELKEAPHGKVYTVWAVSRENKFVRLGQIVNTRGRNEAEIKSETTLPDFGLLVTMEDVGERMTPLGARIGVVEIIR
jgi:hypothetical protein